MSNTPENLFLPGRMRAFRLAAVFSRYGNIFPSESA